ncbi:hypothetical protein Tco_0926965 [Tanacetum coccineum]|uniref:Uncharacterized protein n=1 Tax=Tanacetum coccineum TaxID=301880 RepID=A0ABQ5DBF9_9ASTR
MAALESCPKHNMVAYLEKTDGNAEFHEIIDFLTRSSIHYALTVSLVVSTTFVEQFWMTAKSKTINNVRYITATVAGKPVSISKASIRSDLQFNDAAGIDVLPNQAIFDTIQLMGYEGDLNTLTFNKGLFSPQWKFLFHTIIHCLSSKSTSWDQIPTNIATAIICLATNQVYNFSKLIFDGMMRHLDAKKKFVMYPRFIPVFLTNQLKNVPVPLDHFPINALTTKVFSFMVKKGKNISGNVTPLFPSMLAHPTEDEGAVLERPSETQPTPSPTHPSEDQSEPQPDPFLRPSSSNPIPDSIPEGSSGNHGGQSSSDRSLSGNEDGLTLQKCLHKEKIGKEEVFEDKVDAEGICIQTGEETAKFEPIVHKDPAFDDLDDAMDYMETEDAHDEGIVKDSEETRVSTEDQVSTDKPNEGTAEDQVSTDKLKVSTDKPNEGTAEPNEGTTEPKDGNSDESAAPTTVFRDDETIAQFLVTMSQNKTKQKGFEIKDTDRPRTTTERKKAESDAESEGVNKAERKFAQLANDEEIARKVQEEWEAEEEKKKLAEEEATKDAFTNEYDFIQARLNADKILVEKLQEEKREKFTIKQRAKFLHDAMYVGGYRHAQLNKKKFEEIQVMYEKENIRKRSGRRLKMKAPKRSKRQKTNSDHEEENHLRTFLKIVPEKEEKIDYEVLGTRADGSSRWIKIFSEMIKLFDRMDLADLRIMFESKEDDELWKNQEERKLQSWIFYENCRVYVLRLEDGTEINMLAKRRYPLTKD